jgi:hypothetical protein
MKHREKLLGPDRTKAGHRGQLGLAGVAYSGEARVRAQQGVSRGPGNRRDGAKGGPDGRAVHGGGIGAGGRAVAGAGLPPLDVGFAGLFCGADATESQTGSGLNAVAGLGRAWTSEAGDVRGGLGVVPAEEEDGAGGDAGLVELID